jgi:hypothetical protein
LEIRALEEHNRTLEAEVRKNYKIHIISEKLVKEVRASTARLKEAVLAFRRAHKIIEETSTKKRRLVEKSSSETTSFEELMYMKDRLVNSDHSSRVSRL